MENQKENEFQVWLCKISITYRFSTPMLAFLVDYKLVLFVAWQPFLRAIPRAAPCLRVSAPCQRQLDARPSARRCCCRCCCCGFSVKLFIFELQWQVASGGGAWPAGCSAGPRLRYCCCLAISACCLICLLCAACGKWQVAAQKCLLIYLQCSNKFVNVVYPQAVVGGGGQGEQD